MSRQNLQQLAASLETDEIILEKIMRKVGVDDWDSNCESIWMNGDESIIEASLSEVSISLKYEFEEKLIWGQESFNVVRKK